MTDLETRLAATMRAHDATAPTDAEIAARAAHAAASRTRRPRSSRPAWIAVAACVCLVAAAGVGIRVLGSTGPDAATGPASPSVGTSPRAFPRLDGTWTVHALTGTDGRSLLAPSTQDEVTLTFADGELQGQTLCNGIGGRYVQSGDDGEDLRFHGLVASQVGCTGEPPLTQRLLAVRHVGIGPDGEIDLRAADRTTVAVLRPAGDGAPGRSATPSGAAAEPTCQDDELALGFRWMAPAAGSETFTFTVANTGTSACLLAPVDVHTLAGVEADGTVLPFTATPEPASYLGDTPVDGLAPAETAEFSLVTGNPAMCSPSATPHAFASLRFRFGTNAPLTVTTPGGLELAPGCGGTGLVAVGIPPRRRPRTPTPLSRLTVSAEMPHTVAADSSVRYAVTLTNPTAGTVSLRPCPSYVGYLLWAGEPPAQARRGKRGHPLGCGSVTGIAAGRSVTFHLTTQAPPSPGLAKWGWYLRGTDPLIETGGAVHVR